MNRYCILFSFALILASTGVFAQDKDKAVRKSPQLFSDELVKPRVRVIIDNDFIGDPDGLFQLVHHILSSSVEIRGIIGSHLKPGDFWDRSEVTAANSKKRIEEVLSVMNLSKTYPVYQGSNKQLANDSTPQKSEAADAIIAEAMRDDTRLPLYIVCGAGLTDIASALLMKPEIASRLTLIWIGGPEYAELALPPPGYTTLEYNLGIDIIAGQVVFNKTSIPIWQVPRNAYRQVMLPYSSLVLKVKGQGKIGDYLAGHLERLMRTANQYNFSLGETYIIGDSPLVLLTALQSSFEADPSSSDYVMRPSPLINSLGLYEVNSKGRNIRIYTRIDCALLLEDFFSKLQLFKGAK